MTLMRKERGRSEMGRVVREAKKQEDWRRSDTALGAGTDGESGLLATNGPRRN